MLLKTHISKTVTSKL